MTSRRPALNPRARCRISFDPSQELETLPTRTDVLLPRIGMVGRVIVTPQGIVSGKRCKGSPYGGAGPANACLKTGETD